MYFKESGQDQGPGQLPTDWVPVAISSEVKLPEPEADHLPSFSSEVIN
jgi:hypothetical protein